MLATSKSTISFIHDRYCCSPLPVSLSLDVKSASLEVSVRQGESFWKEREKKKQYGG